MTPFQRALNDFVKSITGQARNNGVSGMFDFMSVTAFMPVWWAAGALDTATPPYYQDESGTVPGAWVFTFLPTDYAHPTAYSTVTTTLHFNYGRQVVTKSQNLPYFLNYPDRYNPALNTHVGDPSFDFRKTGYPGSFIDDTHDFSTGCDADVTYQGNGVYLVTISPGVAEVYTGGINDTAEGLVSGGTGTGIYWNIAANDFVLYNEHRDVPATVAPYADGFAITHNYPQTVEGTGIISDGYYYSAPDWQTIAYSGLVTPFAADCETLLSYVPLAPKNPINCREGLIYFDYFGTSAAYPNFPNYAAGKTYASDGTCVITVPTNTMLGLQIGANDSTTRQGVFNQDNADPHYQDNLFTNSFVYSWANQNSTGFSLPTYIKMPDWNFTDSPAVGYNTHNGSTGPYPACFSFCTQNANVTLHNGTPGAAVTAIVTNAHSNRFIVFPIKDHIVITAQSAGVAPIPILLAVNSNPDNPGEFYFPYVAGSPTPSIFPDCYVCQESRVRVPKNPIPPPDQDVTCFADICNLATTFDLFVSRVWGMSFSGGYVDATTIKESYLLTLAPGETIFTAQDAGKTPTGQGYTHFSDPTQINYSPTGGVNTGGAAGGSSQDGGGL